MVLSWSELRDRVFTESMSIFNLLLVGGVQQRELDRWLIGELLIYADRTRKTDTVTQMLQPKRPWRVWDLVTWMASSLTW